jgi:hypothetical protein
VAITENLVTRNPTDITFQAELASILSDLGRAATAAGQCAEAITAHRRAVAVRRPIARSPDALYNLACDQSLLAGAASRPGSGAFADQARAEADLAVADLRKSIEAGYRQFAHMQTDSDLDPIRGRPEVQALLYDPGFPVQPFAR